MGNVSMRWNVTQRTFAIHYARRVLLSTHGRLFARSLLVVAIGSVALSVFAMLVVLGVMHGFRDHLERKLLGFTPHLIIRAVEEGDLPTTIGSDPQLAPYGLTVVPVVEGEVVAQPLGEEGFSDLGVRVRGMDAGHLAMLQGAHFFFPPSLDVGVSKSIGARALAPDEETGDHGVIVGSEVLYALGLHPEGVRTILLTAPLGMIDPVGNLQPLRRRYQVNGFFRSGLYQQDSQLILMDRGEAERLLGAQATYAWHIYLREPHEAATVVTALQQVVARGQPARGPLQIETWMEVNQTLLGALRLERIVMTLLLGLTVVLSGLSILGVVFMQVVRRRRDFAVVLAMGADRLLIAWMVIACGGWIGALGSGLGLCGAWGVTWWLQRHPVYLPETFYLEYLPFELRPLGVIGILSFGIAMATSAAWYPAHWVSRLDPAEGLRDE
ncbi:MAG: ABC transporter permease [Deltaproteobacteria bacterium]|nr:ABC transporter permease [Deltaproteobacteria bacterium]